MMKTERTGTSRNMATTLALAFITMSVIALVVSGSVGILFLVQTQKEAVAGNQHVVAYQAAEAVAGFIREKFSVMEAAVRLTPSDPERKRAMQTLLGLEPAFRQLLLLNTSNEALFRVSRMSRTESVRLDTQLQSDLIPGTLIEKERFVGSVYVDQVTSEPLVILSVPVATVLGDPLGVLLAEVNLKFIWQLVDGLQVGDTGHAYVVDRKGRLIAFGDTGRVLRGETLDHLRDVSDFIHHQGKRDLNDINTSTGISGNRVVGTYVALEAPDWAVMTELPVREAYRHVIRNGVTSVIFLLTMTAIAGGAGFMMARRLATPIVELTETATRITAGELDIRAEIKGPTEVIRLSTAFNKMTHRLRMMLDKEVDRTRSLELEISQRKEAQKALEESDSILRASLEATEDGVLVVDGQGHISHYNKRFAQIWSIPDDRLATGKDEILVEYVLSQIIDRVNFTNNIKVLYQDSSPSEDILTLKDGRTLERFSYPLNDKALDKNQRAGRVWFFRDITERKRTEEYLRLTQFCFDQATIGIYQVGTDGRILSVNAFAAHMLGYSIEEMTTLYTYDIDPFLHAETLTADLESVIGGKTTFETIHIRKDGSRIEVEIFANLLEFDGREFAICFMQDITERKRTEESLRLAHFIFEKANVGIFVLGDSGEFLSVNEEVSRYLGYSREELGNMTVFDVDTLFTSEVWDAHMAYLRHHGVKFLETLNRRKDGTVFPVQVIDHLMTFENQALHVAFVQDISERKRAEDALREKDQLLHDIGGLVKIGAWKYDLETGKPTSTDEVGRINDLEPGEGLNVEKGLGFYHGENREKIEHAFNELVGQGKPYDLELEIVSANGVNKWVRTTGYPVMRDGRVVQVQGAYQDITERKQDEEELRQLRNYLSNIIDSMPSMLIAVDSDGNVTQWNHKTEQITGLRFEDVRGRPLTSVYPPLTGEMERIKTSILERRVINAPKVTHKVEQEIRYGDITIFPLATNGVEGAVIRVDDVTEKVRMEEMMIQSEKMLSVGGLAAGMAHEINNPLAGILQTAGVMDNRLGGRFDIPANHRAAEAAGITLEAIQQFMKDRGISRMLATIMESGQRMASIVNNMLSFARKSEAMVTPNDLSALLDQTAELAATDYDLKKQYDFKQMEILRQYARNMPDVPCEAAKIQQVLLNILRNGAQAMQQAGTLSPRFILRTRFEPVGEMAVIEIEDNGPGMDEQTRKRIFEPFFTTKPAGVGTGLGLSVSYFIITENHGGEMTVESHPGAGAKFIIHLPVG